MYLVTNAMIELNQLWSDNLITFEEWAVARVMLFATFADYNYIKKVNYHGLEINTGS